MNDENDQKVATADETNSPADLARRLIDDSIGLPASLTTDERVALAWALKDACYAAWTSSPARAAKAAAVLGELARGAAPDDDDEIDALAAWTEGIADMTRGRMADGLECFDRAGAAFRAFGQLAHAAETQVPKIMALTILGRHGAASECAQQARRDFLVQGDRRAAAKVSLNLGSLEMHQDRYAQAARHYREAAVLFARVGDMEHSVMADVGLADALSCTGDLDDALRMFERARMRAERRNLPVLVAKVEESIALLNLVRGRYREALAGLEDARRRYETLALPQNTVVAEKQLADVYLELRMLPEALALYDDALNKFASLDMPQEQAWTLAQQGRTLAVLGRGALADAALAQAAAQFEAKGNRVGTAAVALARAELAAAGGEDTQALEQAGAAADGFSAAGLADRTARADALRASVLLRLGRVDEARHLFDETLTRARALQLLAVQMRCLAGRGLVARANAQTAEAKAAFEAAIELFEDQRGALPGDEIRSAFLSDHLLPYHELLRIALDEFAQSASRENAGQVLQQLERFRARTLSDRLVHATETEADLQAQQLRSRLNWLYRRVRRAQEEAEPAAGLVEELRHTERELLERVRRNRLVVGTASERASLDEDFSVARLSAELGASEALVEYGVIDDELFACIVTAKGVSVRRGLARWSDALKAAQSARFQLETLRFGTAPVAHQLDVLTHRARRRLQQLHALLWEPLLDLIAPYRRIVLVPHAQLAMLPFGALFDGYGYLAEAVEFATVPSARVALLRRAVAAPERALIVGESKSLPHADREARFVAGQFPGSMVFTGKAATIDALRANAEHADVIHLACHAQYRDDSPMFSALHLHDGALTAESIEAIKLRSAVVVLSACETGLAEAGSGDEMVGLVRAFLVAGAARVVASLWPIDDQVTADFMARFYAELRAGKRPAAALQTAQRDLMRHHSHPFYWAGFCLFGGW